MPRGFVKLNDGQRDWYFEWSTVVDAPTTMGMNLPELTAYVEGEYGDEAIRIWWPRSLVSLAARGTTFREENARATLSGNRAGAGESCLSPEQIVEVYGHGQHVARDGRCLLKGHHTHVGPEAVEGCDWSAPPARRATSSELADLANRGGKRK